MNRKKIIIAATIILLGCAGYYALSTRYEYGPNGWERVDTWTGEVQKFHLGKFKSEKEYNKRLRSDPDR